MHEVHPFTDPELLLRWVVGFAVMVAVPGWAICARHLRSADFATRSFLAIGAGLLIVVLEVQILALFAVPVTALSVTGASLVLAFGLAWSVRWRVAMEALVLGMAPSNRLSTLAVVGWTLALGVVVVAAFQGYTAPNHLDDASNHAFMVSRIGETGRALPHQIFAPPYGSPAIPYVPGWHPVAAVVAGVTGVPAWLAAWLLPASVAVLMPIAAATYYRRCGVRPAAVAVAAGFVVANYYTPTNIFSWGGFGAILGTVLLPVPVLALRACIRSPSLPTVVVGALALVAITLVHATEALLALVLLIPTRSCEAEQPMSRRRSACALTLAVLLAVALVAIRLRPLLSVYPAWTASEALPAGPGTLAAALEFATYAGGNVDVLAMFVVPGLLAGMLIPGVRRIGLVSLAFALLYLGLREWHDPLSMWLGRPFYRHAARVIYPQAFLLPALIATATVGILEFAGRAAPRVLRRVGAALAGAGLVVQVFYPGAYWNYRNLEHQQRLVPFAAEDAQLARALRERLGADAVVANQYGDGSYWAMHASGLRFLDPCSWPLGEAEGLNHRRTVAMLGADPWPAPVRALRDLGVHHVYVSDTVLAGVVAPLTRDRLGHDPRFEVVLDNGNAAVFRIRWEEEF